MSLTASMWTSVSGLLVHGEKMNVVGNNISNVNTVGFKADRMDFEDFISQEIGTAAGIGQVGRGTSIGIVMKDWGQGSFETTTATTDIAIAGNGMFMVKPKNSDTEFYTRAGNFRFDKDGFLTDPHGYVLQGWKVDNTARSLAAVTGATATTGSTIIGSGTPTNIRLDTLSCPPKHTNNVTLAVNLDSSVGNDKLSNEDNPFFSLLSKWDATPNAQGKITPLGSKSYAYSNTVEVFDEGGQSHKLTVYFDRVTQTNSTNISNLKDSEIIWEYVVTMEPEKDLRNFTDIATNPLPDEYKGLLMSGTMTYDSAGQMRDMTAYVPTSNNIGDTATWVQAPLSSNGYPMLAPNFSGREKASSALDLSTTPPTVNRNADGYLIEMNFGLRSQAPSWDPTMPATIAGWSGLVTTGTYQTVYKTLKDANGNQLYYQKTDPTGAAPTDYPTTLQIGGLPAVPTWGALNHTSTNPGEVSIGGLVYVQKKASQGLATGEINIGGWVYTQATGTQAAPGNHTGLLYTGSNALNYVLDQGTNLYYNQANGADTGQTLAALNGAGVTLTPTAGARVATTTPVLYDGTNGNQAVPKYQLTTAGSVIQATSSSTHPGFGINAERQSTTSTSFKSDTGTNFYERFAAQDGYSYGELRYVTVSKEGVLSAAYSNGQSLELFQVTLHDFPSKQNLRREGGNLFTETRASGLPISGAAGTGSFGTTQANSLEQSNVDLAREFVQMITTQRGFQANSKSVTTVDTMLDTVINMKR